MDLSEKEERLRFLLGKIDNEVSKFRNIKNELDTKKQELSKEISKSGVDNVSINLYSDTQDNIVEFVNSHVLELENLKNYISSELNKTVKRKDLLASLRKKYGDKVTVEETQFGEFRIKYSDKDVTDAAQITNLSKKLIRNLKETAMSVKKD